MTLENLGIAAIFLLQIVNLVFTVIGFCTVFNLPVIIGVVLWAIINLAITYLGFYLIAENARED